MPLMRVIFTLLLAFASCSRTPVPGHPWQEIAGRDGYPVYRARVPQEWKRGDPLTTAYMTDTTMALCEFVVGDGAVKIVVHNFPSDSLTQRIPPMAQIVRWQGQMGVTSSTDSQVCSVSHGGFTGLRLAADGILAWAMQLSPAHYRALQLPGSPAEQSFFRQMRSDYTIKVTGPQAILQRHRADIEAFAMSFELIQEVPSTL